MEGWDLELAIRDQGLGNEVTRAPGHTITRDPNRDMVGRSVLRPRERSRKRPVRWRASCGVRQLADGKDEALIPDFPMYHPSPMILSPFSGGGRLLASNLSSR
jgi:hypothetical protein